MHDAASREAALIDSVLDFDPASGRTATRSAQRLVDHVREHRLSVRWLLETHAHADHLSAAPWLQQQLGGRLAIGLLRFATATRRGGGALGILGMHGGS